MKQTNTSLTNVQTESKKFKYSKTFQLSAKDAEFYNTDKITLKYAARPQVLPNMFEFFNNTTFERKLTDFSQLIIKDKNDLTKFKALVREFGVYLSPFNSKVAKGAYFNGFESPLSFGKVHLATCMYADKICQESCYQLIIGKMYFNSYNAHLYNSLIFANLTMDESYNAIKLTLDRMQPDIIRLLDDGDMTIPGEFVLWDRIAKEYPHIRIYGYTKAGELIHMSNIKASQGVIWNLSDNGDKVSQDYVKILGGRGFKVCKVQYNPIHDESIPFNNEESVALMTPQEIKAQFHTLKFQIGYHGSYFPETNKFFHNLESSLTVKVC